MDPMRKLLEDIMQKHQAQADDCAAVKAEVRASLDHVVEVFELGGDVRTRLAQAVREIYGRGNQLCPGCQRELLDYAEVLIRIAELEQ